MLTVLILHNKMGPWLRDLNSRVLQKHLTGDQMMQWDLERKETWIVNDVTCDQVVLLTFLFGKHGGKE